MLLRPSAGSNQTLAPPATMGRPDGRRKKHRAKPWSMGIRKTQSPQQWSQGLADRLSL